MPPRIDGLCNVTFHAFMGEDGIPDTDSTYPPTQPSGIFRTVSGELEMIAQAGDPAPGTAADFSGFPSTFFPATPHLADGRAAFLAAVGPGDGLGGLWSDLFGPLARVALIGEPLPEIAPGATLGSVNGSARPGIVFFSGAIDNLAPDDPRPFGLWRNLGGGREAVVHTGMPAPGLAEGVLFGTTDTTFQTGPFRSFDFNDSFEVAFNGFVTGRRIDRDNDEGIWVEDATGLQLVVREGDTAPGNFGSRAIFHSGANFTFRDIRRNNAGTILFKAEVDPRFSARHPTVYTLRGGTLELLVKGSQAFVADALPGDPAPGTDFTFLGFSLADLNDRGDIVFRAGVDSSPSPYSNLAGIWVDRGLGLELVAIEEGPVPDVPGETFGDIGSVALEQDGTVVFTGHYGESPNRTFGIFRQDPDGSLRLVLREGDQADIDGLGSDIRTIAAIEFDLAASSEAGEKAFEIGFDDGSNGIYTAQILAPPALPPECGDGLCGPGEDSCSCAIDCGGPPTFEFVCTDFVDNDCDGAIDCADMDCASDPVCNEPVCEPKEAACSDDANCCSGKCRSGFCRG
jgi:hypothetical protein